MRLPLSLFQSLLSRLPVALCLPCPAFIILPLSFSARQPLLFPPIFEKRSPLMSFPVPSPPLARCRFLPCPALSFYPCPFLSVSPFCSRRALRRDLPLCPPLSLLSPLARFRFLPPLLLVRMPTDKKFLIIRARKKFFCKFSNKTANTVVVKV